jgi:hypothetical protein
MSPQLTVQNAQVSTATVEIKTLTVSGRQVTLALFRQFIEAPLIAKDGKLAGVAWGTVNYHPDNNCRDDPPHWHVVWQLDDELRRSRVTKAFKPESVFWSEALTRVHAASVHHGLVTGEARYFRGGNFDLFRNDKPGSHALDQAWSRMRWSFGENKREMTDNETGIKAGYEIPEEVTAALEAKAELASVCVSYETKKEQVGKALEWQETAKECQAAASRRGLRRPKAPNHEQDCTCPECLCSDPRKAANHVYEAEKRLQEAIKQANEYSPESPKEQQAQAELSAALMALRDRYATKSLDALWTAYRRELKAEAARRKRHVKVRQDIANLPQLFIAV